MSYVWPSNQQYGDHYYIYTDDTGQERYHRPNQDQQQQPQQYYQPPAAPYPTSQYVVRQAPQYYPTVQYNSGGPERPQYGYHPYTVAGASNTGYARSDSVYGRAPDSNAQDMPPSAPPNVSLTLPNFIPGTPQEGWYESLDPSYRMRTGREAHDFFKSGRVFAVLWAETASQTRHHSVVSDKTMHPSITRGRFGQDVHSQIRRFVIVRVMRKNNFVYACPISTYSGRGTLKNGCNPTQHTIVHFDDTSPRWLPGEYERGMDKEPIKVRPSRSGDTMDPNSRLFFGKVYPIEWNVKVKDIGQVCREDMSKLVAYWREADQHGSDAED